MNEVFNTIKTPMEDIIPTDFVGSWQCTKFTVWDVNYNINDYSSSYTLDTNGIFLHRDYTLTITDNGNGTLSWNSGPMNAFIDAKSAFESCPGYGTIAFLHNVMGITRPQCNVDPNDLRTSVVFLSRLSDTRFKMLHSATIHHLCDKLNLPPAIPTELLAEVSGFKVILTWIDESNDETHFKIMRKDSLKGSFTSITEVAANVTSYEDTVSTAGVYWYRIIATNENGDSLGSNVMRVQVE